MARGKEARPDEAAERRRGGMRAIAASLPKVTGKAVGRRGLGEAGLIAHWAEIVGAELAAVCLPRRISYPRRDRRLDGALTLRVAAGHALSIQHLEPIILARINQHLGYAGVSRLKLQQGPIGQRPRRRPPAPPPLDAETLAALDHKLAALDDEALATAFRRLGSALAAGRAEAERDPD